jgi:signal transduction histidine kinase
MLAIMGGWIVYQRNQRNAALLRLRQQIASDLHDEIGANLGSISMVTSFLSGKVKEDGIRKKLAEVGHIAQESFSSVQELIWLIDDKAETAADLLEKIEETAKRILVNCHVTCNFPDIPNNTSISLTTRKSVLLLFKEALYNCAKYAEAENVKLSALVTGTKLQLSIEDDGQGFDLSAPTAATHLSGRGLKNMQQRAKLMGAELNIKSELGKGTAIVVRLPLK